MRINHVKTPFPWFGGKSEAAPQVWAALGDPAHYVEPFAGSLAVLMRRPHSANRAYYSETVNDADGLLINAWRSIQMSPDATAEAASWPVMEADIMARHLALLKWRGDHCLEALMADPEWHDPKMAGWWLYGQCAWIGSGWCSGDGPWVVGSDGRITKRENKEPGVSRKLPHVGDNGMGVNTAVVREPGVTRQLPFLSGDGRGLSSPQLREQGVGEYHPMVMPELREWFRFLSARLRHVRVLNGDWKRVCTDGALKNLSVRNGGHCGVFLDPPYADTAERSEVYTHEDLQVAHEVREWALSKTDTPWLRIVFAGYDGEHGQEFENRGWKSVEWFRPGFMKGGMRNIGDKGSQQHRERLWMSPSCLTEEDGLFF